MTFVMRVHDQKKALGYLKRELGEDSLCYRDLKVDFIHRMLFMFGSIIASTALLVSVCAFYRAKYGDMETFAWGTLLFVFLSINIACSAFEDSLNVGFWKWNRYYRLWFLYKRTPGKKIPSEVLMKFSEHYLEKDDWDIKSYKS